MGTDRDSWSMSARTARQQAMKPFMSAVPRPMARSPATRSAKGSVAQFCPSTVRENDRRPGVMTEVQAVEGHEDSARHTDSDRAAESSAAGAEPLGRQYRKLWTASTASAIGDGLSLT